MPQSLPILPLLLYLLLSHCTAAPSCTPLPNAPTTHYLSESQTSQLSMSEYFSGYNLTYASEEFPVTQHIEVVDNLTIPEPLDPDVQDRIDTDIFKDPTNSVWGGSAFTFKISTQTGYNYAFGNVTDKNNVVFGQWKAIPIDEELYPMCYEGVLVNEDTAWITCQYKVYTKKEEGNEVDYEIYDQILVVDVEDQPEDIQKFTFLTLTNTLAQKAITLQLQNSTYVLILLPNPWIHYDFDDQTFFTIYQVDQQTSQPIFKLIVNSTTLGLDSLTITDISTDEQGTIFLSDRYFGLRSLRYNQQNNTIWIGPSWQNQNQKQCYQLGAVRRIDEDSTSVVVVCEDAVQELQWREEQEEEVRWVREYGIEQEVSEETDYAMFMNQQYFVLKTNDMAYVYEFGVGMLASLQIGQLTQINFQKLTNNLLTISYTSTTVYLLSPGLITLNLSFSREPSTSTITAKSTSENQSQTCSISLQLNYINDPTIDIIKISTLPPQHRVSNMKEFELPLHEFFLGNDLELGAENGTDVTYEGLVRRVDVMGSLVGNVSRVLVWGKEEEEEEEKGQEERGFYWLVESDQYTKQIYDCTLQQDMKTSCTKIQQKTQIARYIDNIIFVQPSSSATPVFLYRNNDSPSVLRFLDSSRTIEFDSIDYLYGRPNHPYIYVLGRNIIHVLSVDDDFEELTVISRSSFPLEKVESFYPTMVITEGNLVAILNMNSVIIVRILEQTGKIIFLSIIKISTDYYNSIALYRKTLLIASVNPNTLITPQSKLLEYSLINPTNPLLLKSLELPPSITLADTFPLRIVQSNQHVFLISKNSEIIVLQMSKPSIVSIPTILKEYQGSYFGRLAAGALNGMSLLMVTKDERVQAYAVEYQPMISAKIHISNGQWRKQVELNFTVKNRFSQQQISTKAKVLNDYPYIQSTGNFNSKMLLPVTADNQQRQLNITHLFRGAIAELQIQCPMCDGDKISLTDYFQQQQNTTQIKNANHYIYFPEEQLIWTLANRTVFILDVSGNLINQFPIKYIPQDGYCYNWRQYNETSIILYCQYSKVMDVFLFVVKEKDNGRVASAVITIPEKSKAGNVLTMKTAGRWLFVLDNDIEGEGQGVIRIFQVDTTSTPPSIALKQTLAAYPLFSPDPQCLLQDLQIISTRTLDEDSRQIMLISLSQFKLVYGVYDPSSTDFSLQDQHTIDFELYFSDYTVDNNELLQIETLASVAYRNNTQTIVDVDLVVTTAYAEHLRFRLKITFDFSIRVKGHEIVFVQALRKYGDGDVLNWAESVGKQGDMTEQFMVAYRDQEEGEVAFAWYDLGNGGEQVGEPKWFRAALTQDDQPPTPNPHLSCLLFQTSDQQLLFLSNLQQTHTLYTLTPNISLMFNYEVPGNFTSITLTAVNTENSLPISLQVQFRQPVDDSGLKWYVIVIIGCGVGVVLLGIAALVVNAVKRRREREKMLLEQQEDRKEIQDSLKL